METEACSEMMKNKEKETLDNFLDDCNEKFKPVGESVSLLMTYIDLQHEATEILLKQLEKDFVNEALSKDCEQRGQDIIRISKEHMMKLEGTVLHAKDKTIASLGEYVKLFGKFNSENSKPSTLSSFHLLFDADLSSTSYKHKEDYIKQVLKENEDLHKKVSCLETHVKTKDSLEITFFKEKESLQRQQSQFEQEIDDLLAENTSFRMKYLNAEEESKNINGNLKTLQQKQRENIATWESEERSFKSEIEKLKSLVEGHAEHIEHLKGENNKKGNLIESNLAEIDRYKEMNQSLESEVSSLKGQLALLNDKKEQLESDMKECANVKNEKEENLRELQAELTKLKELIDSLKEEKQSFECEISLLQNNVIELENKNKAVQTENQQQKEQIEAATTTIENVKKEKHHLQNENGSLQSLVKRLERSEENIKDDLDKKIDIIKLIENERDVLKSKCSDITQENDKMNNEINRSNKRINDLQTDVVEKDGKIQQQQRDISSFQETMEKKEIQLQQTIRELRAKVASLQTKLTDIVKEKDNINESLIETKVEYSKKAKESDERVSEILHRIDELDILLRTKTSELESSRSKVKTLSGELETKKEDNERLKGILQEKEKDYANLKAVNERERQDFFEEKEKLISKHEGQIRELEKIKAELGIQLNNSKEEMRRTQRSLYEKESRIKKLEQKIIEKHEEIENLSKVLVAQEAELDEIKGVKIMQVQLYSQNRTHLTDIVEEGLTALLKGRLESEKLKLDIIQCAKSTDIQPDIPVLLLCITVSRLGTDASNCIQGLTVNSKMALLVFHHKDVHALPNQASDRVLTGADMKALGGICDMAFLSGKGIYSCDMNKNNIISLISFLNREGVRKSISTLAR